MSFEGIVGHAGPIARLKAIVASGRIAGGYLFTGPEGVGKRMVAEAFARELDAEATLVTMPEDGHEISIDIFRGDRETKKDALLRHLSLKPIDARRRFVIIDPADRLSDEAQNSLLKSIEEPFAGCTFVLITDRFEALFPTIRSRCHTIIFTALPESTMSPIVNSLSSDNVTREWISALAAGSPGRAKRMADNAEEMTASAKQLFESLAAGMLNPVVERLSRIRDTKEARRQAREVIDLAILALREELRSREMSTKPRAALLPEALRPRLASLDSEDLADRIRELLDHLRWIDMNANVGLAVENALLRI